MASAVAVIRRRAASTWAAPPLQPQRRVVVTGIGLVTPLGVGVERVWSRLTAGETAVRALAGDAFAQFPSKVAAQVPRGKGDGEFDVDKYVGADEQRKTSPFIDFALAAAEEALVDARWKPSDPQALARTGVAVGAGMGSIDDICDVSRQLDAQAYRRVSPHFIPKILINLAGGLISIRHKFGGPNHAVSTACATGAHAIGDAYRFIKFGEADVMVAGGTEASINPVSFAGFSRAKALSTKYNDRPHEASRPFDKGRDGFVMGEGSAILVLEEMEHAKARGARIYAELRGYGLSGDAHHITAPSPGGEGALRAMRTALAVSGLAPTDIAYVNAHATSTPLGDEKEAGAIAALLGPAGVAGASVSSTKGAVGHLLGAAGAIEAAFSVLAVHRGVVPPTCNLSEPDVGEAGAGLRLVAREAERRAVPAAMSNSFGFGGTNASLVFAQI
eukprot:tig00000053_g23493.t1